MRKGDTAHSRACGRCVQIRVCYKGIEPQAGASELSVQRGIHFRHGLALFQGVLNGRGHTVSLIWRLLAAQDSHKWTNGERIERADPAIPHYDNQQYQSLADGTAELTSDELQMSGRGLTILVGWLMEFPAEPLLLDFYLLNDRVTYDQDEYYRLTSMLSTWRRAY
jgi:hypothetical protein